MTTPKDSRAQSKILQQAFLSTAQSSIQILSNELQKVLIDTIIRCPTKKCVQQKSHNISELNKNAHNMLQHIGNGLEECIKRQYEFQGIQGYDKCYTMFQRVIDWEFKGFKKGISKDIDVKRGMDESVKSKQYQKVAGSFFKNTKE